MPDEDDFAPRLGRPGRDRPRSQLSALAKSARWGKVRTYARPKLAWGTVRCKGRGKGAAAITHHHVHPNRRRTLVRASIAVVGPVGVKAFSAHIAYISRDGTPEQGGPGRVFDRSQDEADPRAFNARARQDERQFRWMISPQDVGEMQDLRQFTRTLMKQVERDLRREVDWVAASHYNTAHPHIHIAVRGGNPRTDELIIARRYLMHGLRHRVEEAITSELGLMDARGIAAFRSRTMAEDRATFIDRELARSARAGVVDLRQPAAQPGWSTWSMKHGRLHHLQTRGLAKHLKGSTWRLKEGWREALQEMTRQQDLQVAIPRSMGGRFDPGNLQAFASGEPGAAVTGRLSAVIVEHTRNGRHIVVVEGLDGRQWTAGIPARDARALPETGSVITMLAPPAARGAPPAIDPLAESPPPRFLVHSWIPVEQLVKRHAFTWLDSLEEADVSAAGFGAEARAARLARQAWLQTQGLYPALREDLEAAELRSAASFEAARLGKRFVTLAEREVFRGTFQGHVDTAQGRFAVIATDSRFVLAAWSEGQAPVPGQPASVERSRIAYDRAPARSQLIPR